MLNSSSFPLFLPNKTLILFLLLNWKGIIHVLTKFPRDEKAKQDLNLALRCDEANLIITALPRM